MEVRAWYNAVMLQWDVKLCPYNATVQWCCATSLLRAKRHSWSLAKPEMSGRLTSRLSYIDHYGATMMPPHFRLASTQIASHEILRAKTHKSWAHRSDLWALYSGADYIWVMWSGLSEVSGLTGHSGASECRVDVTKVYEKHTMLHSLG